MSLADDQKWQEYMLQQMANEVAKQQSGPPPSPWGIYGGGSSPPGPGYPLGATPGYASGASQMQALQDELRKVKADAEYWTKRYKSLLDEAEAEIDELRKDAKLTIAQLRRTLSDTEGELLEFTETAVNENEALAYALEVRRLMYNLLYIENRFGRYTLTPLRGGAGSFPSPDIVELGRVNSRIGRGEFT